MPQEQRHSSSRNRMIFIASLGLLWYWGISQSFATSTGPLTQLTVARQTLDNATANCTLSNDCVLQDALRMLAQTESLPPLRHRVVLLKTHKTASTTLANIFMRAGVHRGNRFLNVYKDSRQCNKLRDGQDEDASCEALNEFPVCNEKFPATPDPRDFALHHMTRELYLSNRKELELHPHCILPWYERIMGAGKSLRFITTVRQPLARLQSWHNFYVVPPLRKQDKLRDFKTWMEAQHQKGIIPTLAREFGFSVDANEVKEWLEYNADKIDFLVSELLDVELVILADELGMGLQEVMFIRQNDAAAPKATRYDGKALKPWKADAPVVLNKEVSQLMQIDDMIYNFALQQHKQRVSRWLQKTGKSQCELDRLVETVRQGSMWLQRTCAPGSATSKNSIVAEHCQFVGADDIATRNWYKLDGSIGQDVMGDQHAAFEAALAFTAMPACENGRSLR